MPNPPHPIQQMNDKYARRCGELALQWRLVHREREDGDKMFTKGDEKARQRLMLEALDVAVNEYLDDTHWPDR